MHTSNLSYQVVEADSGWAVSFCHERTGNFRRRIDAIRAAVSDAERVRDLGHSVTVSIARPGGASLQSKTLHFDS